MRPTEPSPALPDWGVWIRFELVVPEKNRHREYEIALAQDLFGEWAVIRCWGRIGGSQRKKTDCLPSREDAVKLAGHVARRRLSRGYRVAASA